MRWFCRFWDSVLTIKYFDRSTQRFHFVFQGSFSKIRIEWRDFARGQIVSFCSTRQLKINFEKKNREKISNFIRHRGVVFHRWIMMIYNKNLWDEISNRRIQIGWSFEENHLVTFRSMHHLKKLFYFIIFEKWLFSGQKWYLRVHFWLEISILIQNGRLFIQNNRFWSKMSDFSSKIIDFLMNFWIKMTDFYLVVALWISNIVHKVVLQVHGHIEMMGCLSGSFTGGTIFLSDCFSFFVTDFSFGTLVTENFDLSDCTMNRACISSHISISINLK